MRDGEGRAAPQHLVMSKSMTKILLLFPGLAIAYLGLNLIEFMEFPIDFNVLGRQVHNIRSMTIDGTKSMGNLIEILYVSILGGIGALFCGLIFCLLIVYAAHIRVQHIETIAFCKELESQATGQNPLNPKATDNT